MKQPVDHPLQALNPQVCHKNHFKRIHLVRLTLILHQPQFSSNYNYSYTYLNSYRIYSHGPKFHYSCVTSSSYLYFQYLFATAHHILLAQT